MTRIYKYFYRNDFLKTVGKHFLLPALFSSLNLFSDAMPNMAYQSSTVAQITDCVKPGDTNKEIIRIEVVTTGANSPLKVYEFRFAAAESSNPGNDINTWSGGAMRVYYTGTSPVFSTSAYPVFGSKTFYFSDPFLISNISGQTLSEGTNYFWLTYDIENFAIIGHRVDAACELIRVGATNYSPTIMSPAGNRIISGDMAYQEATATLANAPPVVKGSNGNEILKVEILTTGCFNPVNVTNITFHTTGNQNGTTDPALDISRASLYYTGTNNAFGGAPVAVQSTPNGFFTFNINVALNEGVNYFWLAYDIPASAPSCHKVDGKCTSLTVGGSSYVPTVQAPGKGRYIGTGCPLEVKWDKRFGGDYCDNLRSLLQTADGGYLLGGESNSYVAGDKSVTNYGNDDFWIVKTDAGGSKQWDRAYGGSGSDYLNSKARTTDGGYILGGTSNSISGGNKTATYYGNDDFWIIKTGANGAKQWERSFGGTSYDYLMAVIQTSDGGYLLGGYSYSNGGTGNKTSLRYNPISSDYWIVRTDANGNKLWENSFGSTNGWSPGDQIVGVAETATGCFIAGYSNSLPGGNKTAQNKGNYDYWVIKTDLSGNKLWDQTFGGSGEDRLHSMQKTADGGCILMGNSNSGISGDKSEPNMGLTDYWVVKVDENGNMQWDRTYGGNGWEYGTAVYPVNGGGYIVGGTSSTIISTDKTMSNWDYNVTSPGGYDLWILKLDAGGNKEWDKSFGGYSGEDSPATLQQTADGGYILGSASWSGTGGERSQSNQGGNDFWIIKLGPDNSGMFPVTLVSFSAHPERTEKNQYIIELRWSTATKATSDYFVIEKSTDGKIFEDLGILNASGTSAQIQTYVYTDETPAAGISYYRLRTSDPDGNISYSKIAEVRIELSLITEIGPPYPVPAKDNISFTVSVSEYPATVFLEVLDCTGRKILARNYTVEKEFTKCIFDISSLSKGTYFLRMKGQDARISKRFTVL